MLWAIVIAGVILVSAAALDSAWNGFDDDDDEKVDNNKNNKNNKK